MLTWPTRQELMTDNRAAGTADIGIVMLDNSIFRTIGDVGNVSSYSFPVALAVSEGTDTITVVEQSGKALLGAIVATARELESCGVGAITTCCGFLGIYQRELSAELDVPIAASSLLQVPLVLQLLKPDEKVCVLTANAQTLSPRHLAAVGIDDRMQTRLTIVGIDKTDHLYPALVTGVHTLDPTIAELEVVEIARQAIDDEPTIGGFVIECTNLPPYAAAIRQVTGRPVWDALSLINWLQQGTSRAAKATRC